MMRYLDLFAGIGGFALGAYWAGIKFDKHYFSEIDEYAVSLYQKRFPDAILLGDIRNIYSRTDSKEVQDGDEQYLPQGDWVLSGGFPCQDISVAGKGTGLEGARSGLWFEYARLISELRPRFAIVENVGALTIRGLDSVLGSLAEIGYDASWQDLRASDVGAPHRRERIWIIAYPSSTMADTNGARFQTPGIEQQTTGPIGSSEIPNAGNIWSLEWQRKLQIDKQTIRIGKDNGRGTKIDAIREWWASEPPVCCVVDGLPLGMDGYEGRLCHKSYQRVPQLKGLGNAIVPQIAMLIWLMIKELL
jgi:DNA (cytosine-5)-methyltransferase 1